MNETNISDKKVKIIDTLESIIEDLIIKVSENAEALEKMNFDNLLKSIQTLTRTIQNFIKIIELTKGKNEVFEIEAQFIEKIIADDESLGLAEKLLERLEKC
jgi:hypothetical protein